MDILHPNSVYNSIIYQTMAVGATTTAPNKGTAGITVDRIIVKRVGDWGLFKWEFLRGGNTGATAGSGSYLFTLPNSLNIDTAKLRASTSLTGGTMAAGTCGEGFWGSNANFAQLKIVAYDATRVAAYGGAFGATTSGLWGSTFADFSNSDVNFSFHAWLPIVGWSS